MALLLGLVHRASTLCTVFRPGSFEAARTKLEEGLLARGELGGASLAIYVDFVLGDWYVVSAAVCRADSTSAGVVDRQ